MIHIEVPGRKALNIEHIVLDYNGTVALDGRLLPAAAARLKKLSENAKVYILTADSYGTAVQECEGLDIEIKTFPWDNTAFCKVEIVRSLGGGVACIGNGYNDIPMFDAADLSIAVLDGEGLCAELLTHADVLAREAEEALDMLLFTDRLRATLRS